MNLSTLSPSDFASLAADVLSTELGVRLERFGEGPDEGIDCQHQHITKQGEERWVGQAKRYADVSALLRQMRNEQVKMQRLARPPARYFLVVSCSLLPQHKEQIKTTMTPYLISTGDIYGAEDIEALFRQHPTLYARHHRLWLHSIEQLQQQLYAASFARSSVALQDIFELAQDFVIHPQVEKIERQLASSQVCLIVGDPGSGKSTTAAEIALRHFLAEPGFELHWFTDRSFDEALNLVHRGSRQLFVLDDCFGATFLTDEGALKQRQSWSALIYETRHSNADLRLLFTTRDYIVQQALRQK